MLRTAVGKVHQDLRIWNTKRYEPRPRLAASDEAIGLFRHWARQFYPPTVRGLAITETHSSE